jgi:3',5'-cyclic-AMP phosphodiesterase
MRFVHITDTHVGPTPEYSLRGRYPLPTLEILVNQINSLPFRPDFVLHTGDVVDDASDASYALVKPVLDRLKVPVYYAIGNHDRPEVLQRVLLGQSEGKAPYDYFVERDGVGLAMLDTLGPDDNFNGTLTEQQLTWIHDICTPEGPPLVIGMHHQPVWLDVPWLDDYWADGHWMPLDCGANFVEAISPARNRIRGVFFGHVHRAFQVYQSGILFCSAPSGISQLLSVPTLNAPVSSPDELPGFNLVSITSNQTIVAQHTFRP